MYRRGRSIPFSIFALLLCLLALPVRAQDEKGEAKKSSEESMKKVDDGKPILSGNMLQHMMKAESYRAQQNYGMAMQEDMKAQMLRQQLDENQKSRDKNESRRDTAVYSSDPSQSQLRGQIKSSAMNSPAAASPQGPTTVGSSLSPLSGFFAPTNSGPVKSVTPAKGAAEPATALPSAFEEQVSTEFIVFNEDAGLNPGGGGPATAGGTTQGPKAAKVDGEAAKPEPGKGLEISAEMVEGLRNELGLWEAQFAAVAAGFVSALPNAKKPSDLAKKKKQEDEEFWKSGHKDKAKKVAKSTRGVAKRGSAPKRATPARNLASPKTAAR